MDQIKKRWNLQMRYLQLKFSECSAFSNTFEWLALTLHPKPKKESRLYSLRLTASNLNFVELFFCKYFFYFHFEIILKCTSDYFAWVSSIQTASHRNVLNAEYSYFSFLLFNENKNSNYVKLWVQITWDDVKALPVWVCKWNATPSKLVVNGSVKIHVFVHNKTNKKRDNMVSK